MAAGPTDAKNASRRFFVFVRSHSSAHADRAARYDFSASSSAFMCGKAPSSQPTMKTVFSEDHRLQDGKSELIDGKLLPVAPPGRGLTRAQRARRSVSRTLAEVARIAKP